MKRFMMFVLALAMLLSMAACAGVAQSENKQTIATTEATQAQLPETTPAAEDAIMSEADAIAASKAMYAKIREYSGKDYEAFAALFRNTPEDTIRSEYLTDWQYWDEFDKINYVVVTRNENIFFVNVVHYIVGGQHPNTSMKSACWNMTLSYETGEWKLDYGEDADNSLDITSAYPAGYIEAAEQGRNAATCSVKNRMFMDESAVYEGCQNTEVKFIWQDEEGKLHVAVWFVNGTGGNLSYYECKITLTNGNGERIAELVGDPNLILKAHSSRLITFVFPAEDVLTGTEAWDSAHVHINASFK